MSLLTVQDITKEYRNQMVLNGATLRVHRGERLALIGPNGSGKTTLLRIAMGLEQADGGSVIRARQTRVGYLSQSLNELSQGGISAQTALDYDKVIRMEKSLREMEQNLTQAAQQGDDAQTDVLLKKYSILVEQYEAMDGYTIEARIKSILLGLGLREEALTLPIERLSGGEKMRVALSRILLEEPDLLILDEPTNHLDLQAIEWLENFLKKFEGGVLLVSHDRYFLDQVSTRTAELVNGTITEISGNYSIFMDQKQRKLEYVLQESKRLKHQTAQTNRLTQKLIGMGKIRAAQSRVKVAGRANEERAAELKEMAHREHLRRLAQPKLEFAHAGHISAEIAKAEKLCKRFGNVVLFSQADFLIQGGERVAIIGPNGCGKTTLINILLGWDEDYEGIARLGSWVKYGYIGQELAFSDERLTLLEEMMSKKEMKEGDARRHLARFQFYGDEVDKRIEVLSGGERMRLTLANLMLDEPHCLILDEPTNHLDVPAREALERALLSFRGTVVAISHDRYFLTHCINRILEISEGKINSYNGNYEIYRQVKLAAQQQNMGIQGRQQSRVDKETDERLIDKQIKQDKMRSLEEMITELEQRKDLLEESFNQDTPYEKYQEYQELLSQINELYNSWSKMAN